MYLYYYFNIIYNKIEFVMLADSFSLFNILELIKKTKLNSFEISMLFV